MPNRAATTCNKQGCNGLVRDAICSRCGPLRQSKDKAYDSTRGTAAQRGYGGAWARLRRMQLAEYPLCADCKAEGITRLAKEVHHKLARRDGGTNEFENLMSLCKSHHSQRTARGQ